MTTSPVREFSGFPLAIGEVHGLRIWPMDKYGRLRAKHYTTTAAWRPGINVAECRRSSYLYGGIVSAIDWSLITGLPMPEPKKKPEPPKTHEVPDENCTCGFYAYTGPERPEVAQRTADDIVGVIRGTGRTLIGTHGFRCEKAEIVAFLDPTLGGLRLGGKRREQRRALRTLYPDVPLLGSMRALVRRFEIQPALPDPGSDDFWSLP